MPAVLLGNGFSRAFDNGRFDYGALYDVAGFPPHLAAVFNAFGTRDFETILRRLDQSLQLLPLYGAPANVIAQLRDDRQAVRTSLVNALTQHHPASSYDIPAAEAQKCAAFIRGFDRVFTVNYDLLLYWVIVIHLTGVTDDGFRPTPDLTWQGVNATGQMVHYLHGGLHLWEDGGVVRKMRHEAGRPMIQQLSDELRAGRYPLFVSEGTSAQKRASIAGNDYLAAAFAALSRNKEPLTIYGMALGTSDQHIIDAISSSETPHLTITYWDLADQPEIDHLRAVGLGIATRLTTKLGTAVNMNLVPASSVFTWR